MSCEVAVPPCLQSLLYEVLGEVILCSRAGGWNQKKCPTFSWLIEFNMSERRAQPRPGVTVAQFEWQMFLRQVPGKGMQQLVVFYLTPLLSHT